MAKLTESIEVDVFNIDACAKVLREQEQRIAEQARLLDMSARRESELLGEMAALYIYLKDCRELMTQGFNDEASCMLAILLKQESR